MSKSRSSVRARVIAKSSPAILSLFVLFLASLTSSALAAKKMLRQGNSQSGQRIWLTEAQRISAAPGGTMTKAASLRGSASSGAAQPLSLAKGDFDQDGIEDLAVGAAAPGGGLISLYRGNLDAFSPQTTASFIASSKGQYAAPFLAPQQTLSVPVQPDFLASGNFTGRGFVDLIAAARGDNTLYLFTGLGKGKFAGPQPINVPGSITAVAAGDFGGSRRFSQLFVGTSGPNNAFALSLFGGSEQGLAPVTSYSMDAAVSMVVFGHLLGSAPDAAILSGGQVFVLKGESGELQNLALPVTASSIALGSFLFDRNPGLQIALLANDGSIHIAALNDFDPRPRSADDQKTLRETRFSKRPDFAGRAATGWKIVESFPSVAPFSGAPVFFRTRISDGAGDDLMMLNASGQLVLVSHPIPQPGSSTFAAGEVSVRPYAGSPVAAIATRTNIDGRLGVVAIHQGDAMPSFMSPLPDPNFFVNRSDDPAPGAVAATCNNTSNADTSSSCSLREAILKANATAGADNVHIDARTITLTQTGSIPVTDAISIIGAGPASTIIQSGTTATNGTQELITFNPNQTTAFSSSISGVTMQFGRNPNSFASQINFGGAFDWDGSGATTTGGTLSVTNCVITGNSTTDGDGGGIALSNANNNGGTVTISGTTISNNVATESSTGADGLGGGILLGPQQGLTLSGVQLTNNQTSNAHASGLGGGLDVIDPSGGLPQPVIGIHASTISGNTASADGGGIRTTASMTIDQGSVIKNNHATAGNGGGLWSNVLTLGPGTSNAQTVSLSSVTITGNTAAGTGGGIEVDAVTAAAGNNLSIAFSRLAGNTAPTGSNLNNIAGAVTANNNWWGTNTPLATIHTGTGTTSADPFVVLANTANPGTIHISGGALSPTSTTLTGDLAHDNHGTAISVSNFTAVLAGLPITFNNAIKGTIPDAQPESLDANFQATATFNAGTVGGTGHADATVDQATVTANIIILQPPSISKAFNPAQIATNANSTLSFSVTNGNSIAIDSSFTDSLPSGVVVASTPNVSNGCGGTVTATAGSNSISFSNAALPVSATPCVISVAVTGTTDGIKTNSVTINSTAAGTGNTSTAILTVISPPSITKAFNPTSIPLNGTSGLTFTITNPNSVSTLNGIAFTDSLPAGLVVATPNNLSSTCSTSPSAVAGSSSVTLSGVSLAPGTSCTVNVNVTGTTAGVLTNSVSVSSTNGGTGNTSTATITVVGPPTIQKAFGAATIPQGGSTSLSFTIANPNTTTTLSGIAFTDTLPAGLTVSTPNGLTGTCGGGTITAAAGGGSISLSGASLAASANCTFSVNVTGITPGVQNNTTSAITSTEGGTGGTATASVTVVGPPSIAKVFNPTTIALNGTSSLSFTITNPAGNTVALTGVAFTDSLPAGLTAANSTSTVCGGTLTINANVISLSGASVAVSGTCVFSVTITGTTSGLFTNTTGAVTSTNGGTGNTATANLTVAAPPSITKQFGAATIPVNGTTTLSFTIANPNAGVALSGIAFTDTLPSGLVVATPNGVSSTCGGTTTAVAGGGSVSLSGGTLAAGASCTVTLNVTGTTAGTKNNSVSVTSTEGGAGNTSTASLTVVAPPSIQKVFGAATIPLNGSTSLSFTIANPNLGTALTGIAFTDTLPSGLTVSTPNGLTGSCGGGTITAAAGGNSISLSGASLAANTSCTFSVNVTGTTAGVQNNTTGTITSTEGGTGGTATASVTVVGPPSIAEVFNPTTIVLNGTSSLTFTITNASPTVALTGVAFTDPLPTGLTAANTTSTVCGGTLSINANVISLTGATVAANGTCVFSVTITGTTSGVFTNTTGAVTSTNGGTGNTATATLTVASPPSINKVFGALTIPLNGTTSLSFTITNPNSGVALSGVAFTDNLPAGLVVATPNGVSGTCTGTTTAVAGSGSVSLSGGTLAAGASCTISLNVTGTTAGAKNNSVTVTSTEGGTGNTSTATLTVVGPASIQKVFGAATIPQGGSTSLSFTITNPNTSANLTGIGFTDTLPAGLAVSSPNGLTGSCGGGTIAATAGGNAISLTGASLAANASCTFSVNVTGTTPGLQNNTTTAVTSNEGGTGNAATATITVVGPPSIAKAFNPTSIALNGTSTLTFTITNASATIALTGVGFTDTLPVGLTTPNATATACGGTVNVNANVITLAGATVPAAGTCTFSLTITGAQSGIFTNVTGNVTSTNGGTGNTATATLTVATPPSITKQFQFHSIPLNQSTGLTFTITNPNAAFTLTSVALTDNLPSGLVVATPNGLGGTCNGTATAVAGSSSVTLSGATLAGGASCTVVVNVTGTTAGVKNNTVTVSAGGGLTGNPASDTVTVVAPPVLAKVFGSPTLNLNATTSLTFTVTNPNATSALTVTFSDTLPAGLLVATPSGLTGSCGTGSNISINTTANVSTITLVGGTVAAAGSCTFSVNVVGTSPGNKVNTTGNIVSLEGGPGNTATASITVLAPDLAITKTHAGNFRQAQTGATYTITVSNVGTEATVGQVTVTDTLPTGLTATAIGGNGWTCPTLTSCNRSDVLATNLSYPPITLTVNVANNAPATVTNTATVSGGGDANQTNNTATDLTTVAQAADLTITKTHQGHFDRGQNGATYTITVNNIGPGPTIGTVTVVDTLPNVTHTLVATAIAGTGWTCTLNTLTCTRNDALAAGASYPPITLTVNVPQNIQANVTNTATVSGGGELNTANDTATDPTHIGPPLEITSNDSGALSLTAGASGTLSFSVDTDPATPLGTIFLSCSGLPAGARCGFNPATENQVSAQVTMTITTTPRPTASALPQDRPSNPKGGAPLYASLMLPLFGLVSIVAVEGRRKKVNRMKLRWVMLFAGLLLLMALVGCGVGQHQQQQTPTPAGTFQVTVTAVSSSAPPVTANATVTLTVQ